MDDEDDYLSDKFLLGTSADIPSSKSLTYSERRKKAQRQSEIKNVENRKKNRRQLEEEAREEGLNKSLFERAKAEEEELGVKNKAMNMMLKMGFKLGGTLGKSDDQSNDSGPSSERRIEFVTPPDHDSTFDDQSRSRLQHRKVPLPIETWSGKKGVGLGKRPLSPGAADRSAKSAKVVEDSNKEDYRHRTREEYEERRAVGRLMRATVTLLALDEQAGVEFNVLSLNPYDPTSLPPELLDLLPVSASHYGGSATGDKATESDRLKRQMRLDALQPLGADGNDDDDLIEAAEHKRPSDTALTSSEIIEEAKEFLQLSPRIRLSRVLGYLRNNYHYCFWCGTRYNDAEDIALNCPGEDEEAHD